MGKFKNKLSNQQFSMQSQTCKRLQVFMVSYLLDWPAFIWRFFFGKNKMAGCLLHKKAFLALFWAYIRQPDDHHLKNLEVIIEFFSPHLLVWTDAENTSETQHFCCVLQQKRIRKPAFQYSNLLRRYLKKIHTLEAVQATRFEVAAVAGNYGY